MKAYIATLANQKGGVGKTTSVYALAVGLTNLGLKILMVDFDPQSSLTISTGTEPDDLQQTIYSSLVNKEPLPIKKFRDDLHLVPANIDLSAAEMELINEMGRERVLSDVLEEVKNKYDVILIDSPPSLGLLTINALTASNGVIIPVNCEYLAMRGLQLLDRTISKVRTKLNPNLKILGILPTMYDSRTLHSSEVIELLEERYKNTSIFTPVNRSVRFAEAPIAGLSILDYASASDGANSYKKLVKQVAKIFKEAK